MPNLRGASPVGRGEGSVVRAWRGRSAEVSRVKSRSVGGDSRRESELAGEQQPATIGCNLGRNWSREKKRRRGHTVERRRAG